MATSWKGAPKDPEDIIDYTVDWAADLGARTITDSVFTVASGDVVIVDSAWTDTTASVRLSGGTVAASPSQVNNHITLSTGEELDVTNALVIKERTTK